MLGLRANISTVNSKDPLVFSNSHSMALDGTDDFLECDIANDIIGKRQGTISLWVNTDARGSMAFFQAYNTAAHANNKISLHNVGISGTGPSDALVFSYTATVEETTYYMYCAATSGTSFHGHGYSRKNANYHSAGSGFASEDSMYNNASNMTADNWEHYACTWNTAETFTPTYANNTSASITPSELTGAMRIYRNGVLLNHGQSSGTSTVSNNNTQATGNMTEISEVEFNQMRLGISAATTSDTDGNISHVGIFDARLDDDAITAIYNGGTPKDLRQHNNASSLVGYWTMQEATGGKVFDLTGSGNNFVLNNNIAYSADFTVAL